MKRNWPLIGITVAAIGTVTLIVVMFIASANGTNGTGLPTTTALSSVPSTATKVTATVTIAENGCAFVTIDGAKSLAIWPEGYSQDAAKNVLSPEGTTYGSGDTLTGEVVQTNRAAVLKLSGGGDDDYLGLLLTQCQGSAKPVTIVTGIDG